MLPAADERPRVPSPPAPHADATTPDRAPRIALIGNPNTGKTTVFNRLCGTRAKTSNFPGTTTSARIGHTGTNGHQLEVVDLPGVYGLALHTPESRICRSVILGEGLYRAPDAVLVVVDACNLTRNLMLVGELLQLRRPVVVALNMVDLAQRRGLTLDTEKLTHELGCTVVPLVARRGIGFDDLRAALDRTLATSTNGARTSAPGIGGAATSGTAPSGRGAQVAPVKLASALDALATPGYPAHAATPGTGAHAAGVGAASASAATATATSAAATAVATAAASTSAAAPALPGASAGDAAVMGTSGWHDAASTDREALEAWADRVVASSLGGHDAVGAGTDTLTERLDKTFTHPVLGLLVFVAIMGGLFYTLFALATVPMDLIEATFALLGSWVTTTLPEGALRDLTTDGIIGGIAGTVVFLPQICLLFFLISILEDTGYLARAAFVMDRLLCRFGLPGHAFVPLLSSHACALPGIMSTRLIPDRADRLATILVAPLMSCSARLPVYVLLTSMLFIDRPLLAGLAFASCYLLGAAAALLSAFVIRRTLVKGVARPMVLELPTYKVPSLTNALLTAKDQGLAFLKTAGTVIMAICVVMWWLNAYPRTAPPAEAEALRAQAAQLATTDQASPDRPSPVQANPDSANSARQAALIEEADRLEARAAQANSLAGRIGKAIQPIFAPLGYDWQLTVGVLTSFLAREVFVSTMSVLLGGTADADVEDLGVLDRIRSATRDDGQRLFTPAVSASMLIFFVLAMQCLSTLAVTRQETGGLKWAAVQFAYMSSLAYAGAFVTYQGLRLFGIQ